MSRAAVEAELLAQILAAPADDAPRLAYADYLIERGDPRGEYIALQVEGVRRDHRGAPDADVAELAAYAAALWDGHREAWAPELYGVATSWARGFPDAILVSGEEYLAGRAVFARYPLRKLAITGTLGRWVADVAAAPELARFRELALSGAYTHAAGPGGAERFVQLVASPHLDLRGLEVGGHDLGPAAAAELARAPWLPRLTRLFITNNPLGDAGCAAIADALRAIVELSLCACDAGDATAAALGSGAEMPRLNALDLSANPIGPAGRAALEARAGLVRLVLP